MAESKSIFNDSFKVFDPAKQKRKKARIRIDIPTEYKMINSPKFISGHILDLSTGGLTLQSSLTLYQGDKIILNFKLNQNQISVDGDVLRVHGKNSVIRFHDLKDETIEKIQEFIHSSFFDDKSKKKIN